MEYMRINKHKQIQRIGLLVRAGNNIILGMRFLDAAGNDIVKQAWKDDSSEGLTWVMQDIPKGKEIIGVYGNKSKDRCYIKSLGFVLWTPNPHVSKDLEMESGFISDR